MIFTKTYRSRVMWSCQIILILCSESTARRTDRRGRRSLQYKIPFRHDSCQRSKDFATREALKNVISWTEIMSAKRLQRFFFGTTGAKKKLCKKKAPLWGVSLSAESDQGYAPWMCAAFWKRRAKTFNTGEGWSLAFSVNISSGWSLHPSVNKTRVRGAGTACRRLRAATKALPLETASLWKGLT